LWIEKNPPLKSEGVGMVREYSRGTGIASPEGLFAGRLVYQQPQNGYRSSVDSLALIYFVQDFLSAPPTKICDLGCGSGFLALVAALLWPSAQIVGVELSRPRARFARANAKANSMDGRVEILEDDIRDLNRHGFDLILSNPPYHPVSTGTLPKDPENARARFEVSLDLAALVAAVARSLAENGVLCLVYPEGRWEELVVTAGRAGLVLERWRRVHPTETKSALLVVAAFRNHRAEAARSVTEPGPPLILETVAQTLGKELREFTEKITNSYRASPNLPGPTPS
jgi:tRNA1Val (adenine37-N6)-methyltransferase